MALGSLLGLGVSALGGLLGGRKSGGGGSFGQASSALQRLNEPRRLLSNLSQQGLTDYNRFGPQADQALGNYASFLRDDPYTDQYSQAALSQATQGLTGGYMAAKANLSADLAQRGIAGGPSSGLAGGLAGIEGLRAGALGQAQMGLGMQKIDDRERRLAMLLDLLSGRQRQGLQTALGGASGMADIDQDVFRGYMGMGQMQEQAAQQSDANLANLFGVLGQAYDAHQSRRRR